MSQVREIKCPHCGKWTLWQGDIDDRCFYCDGFLETHQFSIQVEKKIRKEVIVENDYFFVNPDDGFFKKWAKIIFNRLRWGLIYFQIAIFIVVTLIIVLISFLPA
jgi:hypothetical protein